MPVVRGGGPAAPSPRVPAVGSAGLGADRAPAAEDRVQGRHESELAGRPASGGEPGAAGGAGD
eukprot:5896637-Alexandrium_andersonii.AAC.1